MGLFDDIERLPPELKYSRAEIDALNAATLKYVLAHRDEPIDWSKWPKCAAHGCEWHSLFWLGSRLCYTHTTQSAAGAA